MDKNLDNITPPNLSTYKIKTKTLNTENKKYIDNYYDNKFIHKYFS